jgi:hypothetical protein
LDEDKDRRTRPEDTARWTGQGDNDKRTKVRSKSKGLVKDTFDLERCMWDPSTHSGGNAVHVAVLL